MAADPRYAPVTAGAPGTLAAVPPLCPVLTEADPSAPGQPQEQTPVGGPHAEVRLEPQLSPRGRATKEEEKNLSMLLHKLQIKSLLSAW